MSYISSVSATDDIFSQIINTADEDIVELCVRGINNTSDDSLTTSARIYQMGMCHFCVDCNYEADNGQLFLADDVDRKLLEELSLSENYKIAYKLISQAAELDYREANYGLAVLLYVKDLGKSRQYEFDKFESKQDSLKKVNNISEAEKNSHDSMHMLIKDVFEKSTNNSFNQQIHKHLLLAAKQGYMPAQFALSEAYFKGIGIQIDDIEAYAWASAAVAQNPPFGSLRRDEKAINLDNEMRNKAEDLAEEYIKNYTSIFDSSSVSIKR